MNGIAFGNDSFAGVVAGTVRNFYKMYKLFLLFGMLMIATFGCGDRHPGDVRCPSMNCPPKDSQTTIKRRPAEPRAERIERRNQLSEKRCPLETKLESIICNQNSIWESNTIDEWMRPWRGEGNSRPPTGPLLPVRPESDSQNNPGLSTGIKYRAVGCRLSDGRPHGLYREYYESGELATIGGFAKGLRVGVWKLCSKNGGLIHSYLFE